ncbi:MAG: hypothetical protein PHN79_02130 [Methanoregula sp.]|nr:hypothetical protein [Methanoregula sp.]
MTCTCSVSTKQWVSAILVIIIIGALTLFAYTSAEDSLSDAVQDGMKSTVGVMATQVNASDIANLKPGDETSPQYVAVANNLKTMRSMNDHIVNAYILKVNPDQSVTFLVDDLYPADPQGSAKIGEVSTSPDKMEIFHALSVPTASKAPYTTKYGSFMSAYAPIDDSYAGSTGNTQAVLAIDMPAADYVAATSRGAAILVTGIVAIIIAVGAIFVFGRKPRAGTAP